MHEAILFEILEDDLSHRLIFCRFDLIHDVLVLVEHDPISLALLVNRKTDVQWRHAKNVRQDWNL